MVGPAVSGLRREEPGHEVHRPDRHADAENDPGEHLFRLTLSLSEHQPAHDDGDQR